MLPIPGIYSIEVLMGGKKMLLRVLGLVAISSVAQVSSGAALYDSGGFDNTTRFATNAPLQGQDAAVNKWLASFSPTTPGATATVIASADPTMVKSAGQAIKVQRTNGNAYWFPSINVTPTTPNNVVSVSWSMNVIKNTTAGQFGPFFGIEVYDASGSILADGGVDASTYDVQYYDASAQNFGLSNTTVTSGYHNYQMLLDYTSKTYSVLVDGSAAVSNTAFGVSSTTFGDADITALTNDAVPNQTGVAYFDNYSIASVPEPTLGVATVGFLSLGLLGRRRCAGIHSA